jgi:protein-L-isoaspartate(D-aspartate) O-methyltransferase
MKGQTFRGLCLAVGLVLSAAVLFGAMLVRVAAEEQREAAPRLLPKGSAEPLEVKAETGVTAPPAQKPPLVWDRPRFDERKDERLAMVRETITERDVEDEAVLDAMRQVPRHRFVPEGYSRLAYADQPLPIGLGQTISQPYVVAFMTEMLNLKPGDKVLEVGTGGGYQAAVLSELTPHVFTIEILRELAEKAAERLKALGYKTVEVKQGDGYYGWKEHGPFDAIIVTAAAGHVPPPLLGQLKPGGRMAIPVGGVFEVQHLLLVTKDEEGRVRSKRVLPVQFVPMTGRVQGGD